MTGKGGNVGDHELGAAGAVQEPPARTRILAEALDSMARLRDRRLPWSVLATNLCVAEGNDLLCVDLVAGFGRQPVFVAIHCAAGTDAWWFSRHPQVDQHSRWVWVDEYVVREGGVDQRPVRFGHSRSQPFRLAAASAAASGVGETDWRGTPVGVAVDTLRTQDAIAQKWLPTHAGETCAKDKKFTARVVSVILTDRVLHEHPAVDTEGSRPDASGAGMALGHLEWLWLECAWMRPALVQPQAPESRFLYGCDTLFTRDVAIARAGSLDTLLTSDGWPDSFW